MKKNIYGQDYDVIGTIEIREGVEVPILDIPLMSDAEWQRTDRIETAD